MQQLECTPVIQTGLLERVEQARSIVPRALFIVGEDRSASWQWRVAWPTEFLSNRGFVADWCLTQNAPTMLGFIGDGRYNMVVTPRIHWPNDRMADEWAKLVHDAGLAWLYEVDDDGWAPDIARRQAKLIMDEWKKGEYQLEQDREHRIKIIQTCDAVILSSEYLASVAAQYTDKPAYCIPNFIHRGFFEHRVKTSKRMVPPLTVGWSGGLREDRDLATVAEAWTRVAARYPDVTFVVHGTRPPILLDAVAPDRVVTLPWTALPDYPRALMNLDIACCSVSPDDEFNESKTPIKWFEASLTGAACVVSHSLYGRYVHDGQDALVASTVDEWEHALSRLVESKSLRRRLTANAKRTVREHHSLEEQWVRWIEVMAQVLVDRQQKAQLHAVA
jgi:glycosyltransferase involved in cell wall biosynthesis